MALGKVSMRTAKTARTNQSNLELSDMEDLKQKTFDIIYDDLINDEKYMKDTNRSNNEREFKSPLS